MYDPDEHRGFRVVRSGDKFYVQMVCGTWRLKWITASGFHRGAKGHFAYQYCCAMNPYAHIESTIPEIIGERERPTVRKKDLRWFEAQRPGEIKVDQVVDVRATTKNLLAHKLTEPGVANPFPKDGIVYEGEESVNITLWDHLRA